MKEILVRSASGLVFISIIISSFLGGPWYVGAAFLLFSLLAALEYVKLAKLQSQGTWFAIATLTIYILSFLVAVGEASFELLWLAVPIMIITAFGEILSKKEGSDGSTWRSIFGLLYIGGAFSLITWLTLINGTYVWQIALGSFVLLWINDTGAFLVGSAIGKHKMLPHVSPGKSWEGLFGGMLLALAGGWVLSLVWTESSLSQWLVIALICSTIGTTGDLFESKLKRRSGVKDSGKIMPGHGGMLDRFDALLFVIPCVYCFLKLTA